MSAFRQACMYILTPAQMDGQPKNTMYLAQSIAGWSSTINTQLYNDIWQKVKDTHVSWRVVSDERAQSGTVSVIVELTKLQHMSTSATLHRNMHNGSHYK